MASKVRITKQQFENTLKRMRAIAPSGHTSVYVYLTHEDPFGNIKRDPKTGAQARPGTVRQYYVKGEGVSTVEEVIHYEPNSRKKYFQFVD